MSESPSVLSARPIADQTSLQALPARRLWLFVLVVGAALWIVTSVIAGVTDVPNLVPNVFVLGSFLVPVAAVLFAVSRPEGFSLPASALILGFLGGGTIGTLSPL
jgi:protease PrsW